ncbi:hypothetical protein CDD82_2810 [Ophiocordyceps australis]|uniref:PUM-HD domain-containing protein n=1 Tax=Ophiocordyceps australis TaxID=1399860 RepID=A0A2C5ZI15_9HYPO|nr:hypothetical protein CDD82_2810 [Ophiocordyceps australis]
MATKDIKTGGKRKASADDKETTKKARLDSIKSPKSQQAAKTWPATNKPEIRDTLASSAAEFDRGGLSSRESHAKQRQLALERKAAKPLADQVQRTKKIWEKLRIKSNVPKEERQMLVEELFGIITGRCKDFVLKHDAVRAVQTAIKYSTPDQRKQIARELQGSFAELAESRYAKFLIGKLLVQNDEEIRDLVISNFYGKVRKLINHSEASWILDDVYRTVATKEQKALLLREWYGPEFSLREMTKDKDCTANLKHILDKEASKRGPIMKNLLGMINALVQKKMTGFTMLHDAMLQYFDNTTVGTEEFSEFVEMAKGDESGDLLKNLAFTKSGSRLACLLFAHGSSKDRKVLLRAYKGTFVLMSGDQYAHTVILAAYDVIDDTKLVSKSIIGELLGEKDEDMANNIVGAVNNPNARTSILYLFEKLSKALFPPSHTSDLELLNEVHQIRKTTSKKDNDLRRTELIGSWWPHVLSVISNRAPELVSTAFGCQFVTDVLLCDGHGKTEALEAIARTASGDPKAEVTQDDGLARQHMSRLPFVGRMLKSLVQGGRFDKAVGKVVRVEPQLGFAKLLYPVIKEYIVDWATGASSFVIVAMMEVDDFGEAKSLQKMLHENKKLLQQAATEMTAKQQAARQSEEGKASKDTSRKKEAPIGNAGSKMLLDLVS